MATESSQSSDSSTNRTKSVLVCLGERKRDVSFTCNGSYQDELKALDAVTREVYSDVLKGGEDILFQVKREEWGGEFTDISAPVPDRAVLMAVVSGSEVSNMYIRLPPISLCIHLFQQSERLTSIALKALQKVKQPSASTVQKLAKLYPSSKAPVKRLADAFDPLQECVALPAKKAKKAARVKPITLEVIVLPPSQPLILPRGKQRQQLATNGRVRSVQFKRTMSPLQIRNMIVSSFAHLSLKAWYYLDVKGDKLEKSDCQQPGGEMCQRRGAVYLKVYYS